jgi:hypothetical protein
MRWLPIEDIPDELTKDGAKVVVWSEKDGVQHACNEFKLWIISRDDYYGDETCEPTHYLADVLPPLPFEFHYDEDEGEPVLWSADEFNRGILIDPPALDFITRFKKPRRLNVSKPVFRGILNPVLVRSWAWDGRNACFYLLSAEILS